MREGLSRDKVIKGAIKKCIAEDVLAEFLKKYHVEVAEMLDFQ